MELKSSFIVFDLSEIPDREDIQSLAVYIISSFSMQRFKQNKRLNKEQMLVIDEAWTLCRFAAGADFLMNLAKRSRHLKLRAAFATQQLDDFLQKEETAKVLSNAGATVLLESNGPDIPQIGRLYQMNDNLIARVRELHQAKGVYSQAMLLAGNTADIIFVRADPVLRWIATTEPNFDVPARNKAFEENKDAVYFAAEKAYKEATIEEEKNKALTILTAETTKTMWRAIKQLSEQRS
jgi:hypothetical protein